MHFSTTKNSLATSAAAALLVSAPAVQALPTFGWGGLQIGGSLFGGLAGLLPGISLDASAGLKIGVEGGIGIDGLVAGIDAFLSVEGKNAWDLEVPNKCALRILTSDNGDCNTAYNCGADAGAWVSLPAFNIGVDVGAGVGIQTGSCDELGGFSIDFGVDAGLIANIGAGLDIGLLHPKLHLDAWAEAAIDIRAIIDASVGVSGHTCGNYDGEEGKGWICGLPQVGLSVDGSIGAHIGVGAAVDAAAAFGLGIFAGVDVSAGYSAGWCTMKVIQHQRNQFGIGADFAFDVVVYDNDHKVIGTVLRQSIDASSKAIAIKTALPFAIGITAKGDDKDACDYTYNDQTWSSGNEEHQCTSADKDYTDGSREGEMGFNC